MVKVNTLVYNSGIGPAETVIKAFNLSLVTGGKCFTLLQAMCSDQNTNSVCKNIVMSI